MLTALFRGRKEEEHLADIDAEVVSALQDSQYNQNNNRLRLGIHDYEDVPLYWDSFLEQVDKKTGDYTKQELLIAGHILEPVFSQGYVQSGQFIWTTDLWPNAYKEEEYIKDLTIKCLDDAGCNGQYIVACLRRDPRGLSECSPGLAERLLTSNVQGQDINPDMIREHLEKKTNEDFRQYCQEVRVETIKAKETLSKSLSARSGRETLDAIAIVTSILSPRHVYAVRKKQRFAKGDLVPLQERIINWAPLADDWRAWQKLREEQEQGIPENLQTPYDVNNNAISFLAHALHISEEDIAASLEQIATEVPIGNN